MPHKMIHEHTLSGASAKNYCEYFLHYFHYFHPVKDSKIRIMEMGIADGQSIRFWENIFPNGEIVAVDLPICKATQFSNRTDVVLQDLNKPETRLLLKSKGPFDIIIDDAGHTVDQQIELFKDLWPAVKDQGVYIIEDLCTCYFADDTYSSKRGNPPTIDFLKELVDSVNVYANKGAVIGRPGRNHGEIVTDLDLSLYSIHFYEDICFIFKGQKPVLSKI